MAKLYKFKEGVLVPATPGRIWPAVKYVVEWTCQGLGIGLGLCIALPIAEAVRIVLGG